MVPRSYDEEADVPYVSLDSSRSSAGVDVGVDVILRYDEAANEVVGVPLVGAHTKLLRRLSGEG